MKMSPALQMMRRVFGSEQLATLVVYVLQYRADPEFWDELLKSMGEDWLSEKQAAADQGMALLKEAYRNLKDVTQ